jgi:hypothetical protein
MPLWLLLIPYAVFLLIFAAFSLVDVLNAWRFRSGFFSASFLIIIYLAGTAFILLTTYILLSPIDWMQQVGAGIKIDTGTLL